MSELIQLQTPEDEDLRKSASQMEKRALALTITDGASYAKAAEFLVEIKRIARQVEERFQEPCSAAHTAWKKMTALRDAVMSPFLKSEIVVKSLIGTYQQEQEQKRQEELRKAEAKARQKAEEERKKAIAEAKERGDREAVKALKEAPIIPQVDPSKLKVEAPPKIEGVSVRMTWDWEIVDEAKIPRAFLKVDDAKIGKTVRALGKNHGIGGITVFEKAVTAAGTR